MYENIISSETLLFLKSLLNVNGGLKNNSKRLFRKHEDYQKIMDFFDKSEDETLYLAINQIAPKKCKVCDNTVRFDGFRDGYTSTFCSISCVGKDGDVVSKRKQTIKETYGVEHQMHCQTIKDKIKATCLERYGVEYATQSTQMKEKSKTSLLKNYGVEHALQNKELYTKQIETLKERFGVDNIYKNSEYMHLKNVEKNGENYRELCVVRGVKNGACNHLTNKEYYYDKEYIQENFVKDNKFLVNQMCDFFNITSSVAFKKMVSLDISYDRGTFGATPRYLASLLPEGFFELNTRKVIKPLELDFYNEDLKFAMEYNGLMFHSYGKSQHSMFNNSEEEDPRYHLRKTELCEEKGIHLFHIFENEWFDKSDIWLSMIKNKAGLSNKIYARKCLIKELDSKEANLFLETNHLQGSCNAKVKLGLFYDNNLVSAMTFGKPRFNKEYEYELIRFASLQNNTVIGGASKLFNYFIKNYSPDSVISYANRRWSQGGVYENLGFEFLGNSDPNYFYFGDDLVLKSRMVFQKHKLKNVLEDYNESVSSAENIYNNGYRKIYDCGNKVYVWKNQKNLN